MLAGIKSNADENAVPTIYTLFDTDTTLVEPLSVPVREFTCPLPSLEEPTQDRRVTRLLEDIVIADMADS